MKNEIYICEQCAVEISRQLYESGELIKRGHRYFKVELGEQNIWSPYCPLVLDIDEDQIGVKWCSAMDVALDREDVV
jgi:protein-arginine kinase activator protein McsA